MSKKRVVSPGNLDSPENSVSLPSERATALVRGDRRKAYGDPRPIAATAAIFWSEWLMESDGSIREPNDADVQMMMALHKVAREKHRPREDNRTDICGYVNIYEETL